MKKITASFIFFLLLSVTSLMAQDYIPPPTAAPYSPKPDFWSRVFVGGNLGLQFGTATFVEISPLVGYHITDRFSAGLGIKYQYFHYRDNYYDYNYNIYGGSVFTRYLVTENLFAHVEYEVLSIPDFYSYRFPDQRIEVTSVLVGGGYRQMMGERSALDILVLFNLNESRNSPYTNPIIRIGFAFGL